MWENVSRIPQDPQVPRISTERKPQVVFASFCWKFCQYTISAYSECYKSVIIILKSLVYTKTVDSVFSALWLATQSVTSSSFERAAPNSRNAPINVMPAGGGGGRQGIGWGFDFFEKFAIKFPAHGQIIPVKSNQISPPQAAHCCQSQGRT